MLPSELIQSQLDYQGYLDLCSKFGYKPTEEEKKEIVKFLLLLSSSASTTLTESEISSKWFPLFEGHGGEDFSFLNSLGSVSVPSIGLGKYVSYLFKRPMLSRLFKEEMMDEMLKLRQWKRLMELKKQLSTAKGEKFTSKVDLPALHRASGNSSFSSSSSSSEPKRPAPKKHGH